MSVGVRRSGYRIEELLPHRGPALLLVDVIEVDAQKIRAVGRIASDHPAVGSEGTAPVVLAVELAAQGAAVLEAWNAGDREGESRIGYLVGLRSVGLAEGTLPAETPLQVWVRREASAPPLARFSMRVWTREVEWATGILSTYLPAEDPRPPARSRRS